MRTVNFEFNGTSYPLFCPAAAVFEIYDKYGYGNVLEVAKAMDQSMEGWDACCWLAATFAKYGRMQARQLGGDELPVLKYDDLYLSPLEQAHKVTAAVYETLVAAFRRDVEPGDREVDMTLQRIHEEEQKKTAAGASLPDTLQCVAEPLE